MDPLPEISEPKPDSAPSFKVSMQISDNTSSSSGYSRFDAAANIASTAMKVGGLLRAVNLSMKEAILICVASVSLIGMLLFLLLFLINLSSSPESQCTNPACLAMSFYMTQYMNTSVNPCDNFYEYACGSWKTYYSIDPAEKETSVLGNLYRSNQRRLQNILYETSNIDEVSPFEWKIKKLFESCLDEYSMMKQGGTPLIQSVISPAGGWYLLGNMSSQWNINSGLKSVHIDFWTESFFALYVLPDPINARKNTIAVSISKFPFGSCIKS